MSQAGPDWIRSIPPLETNKGLYTPELQEVDDGFYTLYLLYSPVFPHNCPFYASNISPLCHSYSCEL